MPVIWTDVVFSTLIIQTKSGVICLAEAWEGDYPAKSLDILLGSAHRDAIQSAWKRGGPLPVCRSFAVAQDEAHINLSENNIPITPSRQNVAKLTRDCYSPEFTAWLLTGLLGFLQSFF